MYFSDIYVVTAVKSGLYYYFICEKNKGFLKKMSLKLHMTAYHKHHCYLVRENTVAFGPTEYELDRL